MPSLSGAHAAAATQQPDQPDVVASWTPSGIPLLFFYILGSPQLATRKASRTTSLAITKAPRRVLLSCPHLVILLALRVALSKCNGVHETSITTGLTATDTEHTQHSTARITTMSLLNL